MAAAFVDTVKQNKTGVHCIAPGCSNYFYKDRASPKTHFHRLPLSNKPVLKQWLQNLKRQDPPVNTYARVCSNHFSEGCYQKKGSIDPATGSFSFISSGRLTVDAVPTIFNFSGYDTKSTDAPSKRTNADSARARRVRKRRALDQQQERTSLLEQVEQPEIPLIEDVCVDSSTQTDPLPCICGASQQTVVPVPPTVEVQSTSVATTDIEQKAMLLHDHAYSGWSVSSELVPSRADLASDHGDGTSTVTTGTWAESTSASACDVTACDQELPAPCADVLKIGDDDSDDDSDEETNEDPDDHTYSPPSSESESEESESDTDTEEVDQVSAKKCIVYMQNILELFKLCHVPGCQHPLTTAPVTTVQGFLVKVTTTCTSGHTYEWCSQPFIGKIPAVNVLIPAALFVSGNSYETFHEMCEAVSLLSISPRQNYNITAGYVTPEVKKMWATHNEAVLSVLADNTEPLCLSGDARCDSPGHCASFGTYTLLDADSHLITAQETIHVTEVKNSYWLEPTGLTKCLEKLDAHGVHPAVLATDRHPTVNKMMREEHQEINHQYDLWHIVKGLRKAISRKKNAELSVWANHIGNHLYYCVNASHGDVLLLKEMWMSVLKHITNKHSWRHTMEKFHKCAHKPYTKEEAALRPWLSKKSTAFKLLQKIVLDPRLLKDIEKVTEGIHTGELESIHALYTKYVPKRTVFSSEGFSARVQLAALDHNTSVNREQAITEATGAQVARFKLQYSKVTDSYVVKPMKTQKQYAFRKELLRAISHRCTTVPSLRKLMTARRRIRCLEPIITLGQHKGIEKPDKVEAVKKHISRFK